MRATVFIADTSFAALSRSSGIRPHGKFVSETRVSEAIDFFIRKVH